MELPINSSTTDSRHITDTIEHYVDAKHVALYSNGKWYVLNVITGGRQLTPIELQKQIIWIEVTHSVNRNTFLAFLIDSEF